MQWNQQEGYSLTSVLVAVGIIAIAFTGFMQLFLSVGKTQATLEAKSAVMDLRQSLFYTLSDRTKCTTNFLNLAMSSATPAGVTTITEPGNGSDLATTTPGLPANKVGTNLTITAMEISDWTALSPRKGIANLTIAFTAIGQMDGPNTISRTIPLGIDTNAGSQITSCVAIGNKVDSPWTLVGPQNVLVFDSSSNVGIGQGLQNPAQKLEVAGGVLASGYFHTSDRRLKTKIKTTAGLDKIRQLRGVDFQWRDSGEASVGLVAQEVEAIYPHLVFTHPSTGLKSVRYSSLIGPLIEAQKDLYFELEILKRGDQELLKKIEILESRIRDPRDLNKVESL